MERKGFEWSSPQQSFMSDSLSIYEISLFKDGLPFHSASLRISANAHGCGLHGRSCSHTSSSYLQSRLSITALIRLHAKQLCQVPHATHEYDTARLKITRVSPKKCDLVITGQGSSIAVSWG